MAGRGGLISLYALHCTVPHSAVQSGTLLHYTVLCHTVRDVLHYTVLYRTVWYVLHCTVLYRTVWYVLHYTVLYRTVWYVLHYTVLYRTVWYFITLHCTLPYSLVLYYITLWSITLYYSAVQPPVIRQVAKSDSLRLSLCGRIMDINLIFAVILCLAMSPHLDR